MEILIGVAFILAALLAASVLGVYVADASHENTTAFDAKILRQIILITVLAGFGVYALLQN